MKKADRYILGFILIASLSLASYLNFTDKNYNNILQIYMYNNFYQEIKFDNSTNKTFTITSDFGWNTIQIKDGQVSIIDADCNDKTCINSGYIDKPGESIVCLPHRLIIKISKDGKTSMDITP